MSHSVLYASRIGLIEVHAPSADALAAKVAEIDRKLSQPVRAPIRDAWLRYGFKARREAEEIFRIGVGYP